METAGFRHFARLRHTWNRSRAFFVLSVLVGLGAFAFLLMLAGGSTDHSTRVIDDYGQALAAILAGCAARFRASREADRIRRLWLWLSASAFAWAAGQIVWSYYELVAHRAVPLPSAADLGFLFAVPFAACAVISLLPEELPNIARARIAVDGLIVAASTLFVGWFVLLGSLYDSGHGRPVVNQVIGLAYPVGDLVIFGLVILAASHFWTRKVPFGLIASALVAIAIPDGAYAYLTTTGHHATGNIVDTGWVLGYLLLALAAFSPASREDQSVVSEPMHDWHGWLPYPIVLLCGAFILAHAIQGTALRGFLLWNAIVLFLAVTVRQIVVLHENHDLTRGLEQTVADRTSELQGSEARLQTMIQHVSDVISVVSRSGQLLYVSSSARDVLGYRPDELIDINILSFVHPDDVALLDAFLTDMAGTSTGPTAHLEVRMRHRSGTWRYTETAGADLTNDPVLQGIVLTTRDVTERRELETQLTDQAFHDSLTNLPNRALFGDRLEHAVSRSTRIGNPLAVLFIDLDDFKAVNDTLGHREGDELLRHVAKELMLCVRFSDTVARLGGDEFAVLMEDATVSDALEAADRIQDRLGRPVMVQGSEIVVSASVGVAATDELVGEGAELMRNADIAMYSAKTDGKARYKLFEASMHSRVVERTALLSDLRHALDRSEMEVCYQPIVALASLEPCGFEALVRWRHPERGTIDPIEFITLAEQTGLIVSIGEFVLEESCRQLVAWDETGEGSEGLTVSVNVSGRQLAARDLVATVERVLSTTGLAAHRLTLELTETMLLDDVDSSTEQLHALKRLGVRLAIDDFGTGYSSLSYLRHLPVDFLKIDRSFIESLDGNRSAADLVRAIIDLGQRLKLTTVAEGIETPEQAGFLTGAGCRLAQGYYFCRPLSVAQVHDYLLSNPSAKVPLASVAPVAPVASAAHEPDIAAAS